MEKFKIILYGLSEGLAHVEKQLKPNVHIVAYSDSFADINIWKGKKFIKPEHLNKEIFDFLVITVIDREKAWNLCEYIHKITGIEREKIIPYYCCCNTERYVQKLNTKPLDEVEVLIVGNSYAECGFMEDAFPVECMNLSVSGQDLFYNFLVIKHVVKYLKKLRYVIIDLYGHTYFNLDTSKTVFAPHYFWSGGYLNEHNIAQNKNYHYTDFETFLKTEIFIDLSKKDTMKKIFRYDDLVHPISPEKRWEHIDSDPKLIARPLIFGSRKIHQETISENIQILDKILSFVVNEGVSPVLTLLPEYCVSEQIASSIQPELKHIFYETVKAYAQEYNIKFFNYKNNQHISKNHLFYYDSSHLNTAGGIAVTSLLCRDLGLY